MSESWHTDQIGSDDPRAFERPSVTVDLVLMSVRDGRLQVLLIRRDRAPFEGQWSFPGGFVKIDETLGAAARRLLQDKARLSNAFIEQLYTFGAVDRDPRARVITVAYYALVDERQLGRAMQASDDLALVNIVGGRQGGSPGPVQARMAGEPVLALAFDHGRILEMAVTRLRGKLDYSPVGFELLPARFTLRQLQEVHEAILGTKLNKPAFRRRMLDKGVLQSTGERESGVTFRPAELYRFLEPSVPQARSIEES